MTFTSAIIISALFLLVSAILGGIIIYFLMNPTIKKLRNELHTLQEEFRAFRILCEEKQKELQGQIENRDQKLLEAQEAYEALTREHERLHQEHSTLQLDLLNLQKEHADLQQNFAQTSAKLADTQKDLQQSQADYYKLQGSYDRLGQESDVLEGRFGGLQIDLNEALNENEKLRDQYTALQQSCDENQLQLKNQVSNKEQELLNLQNTIAGLKKELGEEQEESDKYAKKLQELEKIRERAKAFDYTNMGVAREEEKDDLKLIKGIGPFIEEKLNALGIFTFAQIARFNENDIEQVTDAIEFFPGRIERDHWIDQAIEFEKEKNNREGLRG
ncbi:MAG: hypothetical protein NW226_05575 [Microscillaceae bacterium]|nr:hypothetical protein [Microscillaceae bacterium]